jgi:tetratricopeptide (TPR) repeat protein
MSPRRVPLLVALLLALAAATGCQDIRARQYLKSGNDHYRKGDFKLAVESYKKAEAIRPDIVQVHLYQAYADLSMFVPGDTTPPNQQVAKDAIDAFNRYLHMKPQDEKTRQMMIQTLIDSGRYDDALNFFKAKLQTNPKDLEAIKALGVISSKAGRFEDGLGWYDRRAQVTPDDPEAFYAIGTLCWERLYQRSDKVGEERIKLADRGIAALKHALELKPKYVEAVTFVNLLYRERSLGQAVEEERAKDLEQARYFYQMAMGLRGLATQPASQPASGPASAPAAEEKGAKGAKGAKGVKGTKGTIKPAAAPAKAGTKGQ